MTKARILVVDDEPGMLEVCDEILQRLDGAEVLLESRPDRAAEVIATESLDLLIADIRMPGSTGIDLLRLAREHDANLAVLMITAYPTIETAVESMKLGAAEYITKPFLPEDLLSIAQRLLEEKRLRDENRLLRRQVERSYAFGEIIGRSALMQEVFDTIRRVAETDIDVLIIGETGTGKELVARAIHRHSRRKEHPFVPVDCGAIPGELMESEFFGHERGAFTGAHSRNLGLLEFANQGTFFLDEVSQLAIQLQAKLLRALQERKIRRLGGTKEIEFDLRVIAASAVDLEEQVRRQRFRLDFYHRIHVVCIRLPPLRERGDDILLLADHFLAREAGKMNKGDMSLAPEAREILARYAWPGNVRELANVLKRALVMTRDGTISVEDLPDEIVTRAGRSSRAGGKGFFALREQRMAAFEKEYLKGLLVAVRGNIPAAACEAQLPRGTLYRLLKKCDLNPGDFRSGEQEGTEG